MLDFARMKPRRHVPTHVATCLRTTLELVERRCEDQHVAVTLDCPEALAPVTADPDQLQQVFLNLASNALDAMPAGGALRLSAEACAASNPERPSAAAAGVAVRIADTGTGIPPDDLHRIFDPFYTTKEAGRGTGLGLSVAYGIVEEHGGWIEVRSEPAVGTTFTVYLPAIAAGMPEA